MKVPIDKNEVIQLKKQSIRELNNMLESYLAKNDEEHLKKVKILSHWIKQFSQYISFEENYDPLRQINYKRGNVIRVNFGFNVGKEFGGLHYAVVLDNDSKHHSQVLTVIPLSSTDGKSDIHSNNVNLGTELFEKVNTVQSKLIDENNEALAETSKLHHSFHETLNMVLSLYDTETSEDINNSEVIDMLNNMLDEISEKKKILDSQSDILQRNSKEIEKMKQGSMAVVNQIRTISKQRIYTPKKSTDFLYDISLSAPAMDKINDKLLEMYTHK